MAPSDDGPSVSPVGEIGDRPSFMRRLGAAVRPIDDAAEIQATACAMLDEEFRADRSGYAEISATDGSVTVVSDTAIVSPYLIGDHQTAAFAIPLCDRLRRGAVDVRSDVADDPALTSVEKAAYAGMRVGAAIALPLFEGVALCAFIFLHYRHPRSFKDADVEILQETSDRLSTAIDASRAKAALRISEAQLAAAFESVPAGIAMLDTQGRIVVANSEYRRFLPGGIMPSRDPANRGRWQAWNDEGGVLALYDYPGARALRGERTVPGQEMLFRVDQDRHVWTRVATVPIHDEQGRVTGQASVISDIDALKRASEALRENEARAQLLIDGVALATWETASDGLVETDSPNWRAYTGQSFDEWKGQGWLSAIHPDDRTAISEKWRETVRKRRSIDAEYRLRKANGTYRWMNVRAVPLRDEAGHVVKWLGMNIDIDERKRLERALEGSERRTRVVLEGIPQLLWRADCSTEWTWASPQWLTFTGQSEADSRGFGWLRILHPADRAAALSAWTEAAAVGCFEGEHRLRRQDGAYRWFAMRAKPIRDAAGHIVEWLGTANDIDDLRQAQARQGVMVAELQHRTRNLIAVVQALSEKTLDGASSLADFKTRFADRLSALARVQGLLSHACAGRKVTFDALLQSELCALGANDGDTLDARIILRGPSGIPLRSGAVQALALALHELATNAVKHGALTVASGRLAIAWSVTRQDGQRGILTVEWIESGLAPPRAAGKDTRVGYGRELIERALPFQLKARTSYTFTDDGLRCTISVPVVADRHESEEDR